ncbi:uncharacterized protein LOC127731248 [Mytilus californianus]|uniref:uncharacterized protein LOC127731248 n=1 Tax=Mytilus californianus TaxID=6549 RepID=UPI00224738A5|nr:uncharacterized protein LOC127731248 [Mytilus californianus]
MFRCPSISIQKRILDKIDKVNATDQWMYGVSKQWMEEFRKQFENMTDTVTISNELTCSPLKSDLEVEKNVFLSEKWWKILVTWYGIEKECSIIRHPVFSSYMTIIHGSIQHSVLSKKEVDYIEISTCMFSNIDDKSSYRSVTLYAWDSFEYLENQLRKRLAFSSKVKGRLWLIVQENGNEIVFDNLDKVSVSVVAKLSEYLTWLSEFLSKRDQQTLSRSNGTIDPFLFAERKVQIIVAIEPLSFDLYHSKKDADGWIQYDVDLGGECESIVTLATINNHWDEIFTNCLDELTREVTDITLDKRATLINTAKDIVNEKLSQTNIIQVEMENKIKQSDEKDKLLMKKEREIKGREDELKQKLVQYKDGLDSFMKEKCRLELEWKKVQEQNIITDSQIILNIGGEKFTTSLTTLTNVQDSVFVHLFCGTYIAKPGKDGSYFFDRDGTHFRHILNYLRNGPKAIASIPDEESVLEETLSDAKYYILPELEALIKQKLDNLSVKSVAIGDMEIISYPSFSSYSSK